MCSTSSTQAAASRTRSIRCGASATNWSSGCARSSHFEPSCADWGFRPPPPAIGSLSIRLWQAEDALGDVGQDQLRADRRDAGDLDLATIALDMVLAGIAHAAMGHDRGLAGAEPGLGGAVFGGVGVSAGLLAAVIGGGGAQYHQLGRLELD